MASRDFAKRIFLSQRGELEILDYVNCMSRKEEPTMDASFERVFSLLEAARRLEASRENSVEAATKYYEAIYVMRQLIEQLQPSDSSKKHLLQQQIEQYNCKAIYLMSLDSSAIERTPTRQSFHGSDSSTVSSLSSETTAYYGEVPLKHSSLWKLHKSIQRMAATKVAKSVHSANTTLMLALDLDESGRTQDAIQAYTDASATFLEALQLAQQKKKNIKSRAWDEIVVDIKKRLNQILGRAEQLKHVGTTANTRAIRHNHAELQQPSICMNAH